MEAMENVEILMASFNGEKYISEQIASLASQDYPNWTLSVSDDGSSDRTVSIVKDLAKKDTRIQLSLNDEVFGSASGNFFALLEASRSEYVMFCDQDDVWDPSKISKSMEAMRKAELLHGEGIPVLVFSDSKVVDRNLNLIEPSFVDCLAWDPRSLTLTQLACHNVVQGCTMLMNRALVDLAVSAKPPASCPMHDWWTALLAFSAGHVSYVDDRLVEYRQHEANVVGANDRETLREWFKSFTRDFSYMIGVFGRAGEAGSEAPDRANAVLKAICNQIPDDRVRDLRTFADIGSEGVFKRLNYYSRNNLWRRGTIQQKLYQVLCVCCMNKPVEQGKSKIEIND